ncbi:phosphatases II [Artomyces pyxidatus]|uniref:Phosphatases II n=1 Tax=Artomyces pyxidatus TaxID=48021 RepID=A0ACB8SL80_9AGAM|nr:phosphatases II [Artomyces pyxidatus]
MDAIRIPKVQNVLCSKAGKTTQGTLHLTAHHLIFCYDDSPEPEMWASSVPYPLVNLVTRLPQTLSGQCPITFRCRTFETFSLSFDKESDAADVFDSVKELTVAPSVTQLYAFFYVPNPPLTSSGGWGLYSVREEFGRMGVGTRSKAWRFTDINKDYSFSPTYPSRMVVPTRISDATLQYAVKYRSKGRIPALSYLHWANYGSITRSSQPMVGLTNARSIQDEKLVEAIFLSHQAPDSRAAPSGVFGATSTNLIVDARPTTNAMANTAKGAGTENMDHYKDCKKAYLGIDHIHAMRESLGRVVEALRESEVLAASVAGDLPGTTSVALPVDRQALRRSGWLRHLTGIMEGSVLIVRNVHVNSSHVLIHCSDGWDRTSQLSAVSQLCLDPYYRTVRGFQVLVEKDWLSFGHKFLDRCGHLSSEKFFLTPLEGSGSGGGAEAAQAFLASVQNRFASNHHIKETSPVFHQFLEVVRNIQRQFPERFEFNELFLRQLHYHLYSCQFGSFLFNSEKERRTCVPSPYERTVSVWDYMNSEPRASEYINPSYKPELDDPMSRVPKADQGVLFPNPKDIRFWHELYGRGDEEMNGRFVTPQTQNVEFLAPVENAEEDPAILRPTTPNSQPMTPALVSSISSAEASSSSSMYDLGTPKRGSSPLPHRNTSPSLRPPPSPSRQRQTPPRPTGTDLFANTGVGMKSVWGKLSSGAGAAFSVVQDAYGGVAKDFRGLSVGPASPGGGELLDKGGELRGRDELAAWGGDAPAESRFEPERVAQAVRPSTFAGGTSNPWSTTKTSPFVPSVLADNPWSTARSTEPARSATLGSSLGDVFGTSRASEASGLPVDPTVAQPAIVASPSASRATEAPAKTSPPGPSAPLDPTPALSQAASPLPKPSASPPGDDIDPLGVGLR